MERKAIPDALLHIMAEKLRMLGDPTRLVILRALMTDGEMTVSQIGAASKQGIANVSRHLKLLAAAGLLARRKVGSFVHYRLNNPFVEKICELVCDSMRREIENQLKQGRRVLRRTPRT